MGSPDKSAYRVSQTTIKTSLATDLHKNVKHTLYRTSKTLIVPPAIFCPAPGNCVTMMLAGEGSAGEAVAVCGVTADGFAASAELAAAGAMLTLPNLNPESCTAWLALPSGCPTKFGITNV